MKCSITIVDPRLFAKDLEKIPHTERLQILSTLEDFATQ